MAVDEHVVTYRYRATTGDMSRLLTESHSLFAMDADTGDLIWTYEATDSIRHNAIAIGNGKVFLIDRPMAMFDREKRPQSKEHPTGKLLALDANTGKQAWADDADIYGTLLGGADGGVTDPAAVQRIVFASGKVSPECVNCVSGEVSAVFPAYRAS